MPQTFFWIYPCAYCGAELHFRRPVRYDRVFCGIECVAGHESELDKRVNAIVLPRTREGD